MTERKKKTGDVVGWAVVSRNGHAIQFEYSRWCARDTVAFQNIVGSDPPYRLAKVVLAK